MRSSSYASRSDLPAAAKADAQADAQADAGQHRTQETTSIAQYDSIQFNTIKIKFKFNSKQSNQIEFDRSSDDVAYHNAADSIRFALLRLPTLALHQ